MYCKIEKKSIVSNLLRFITTIHNLDTFEANWVLELDPALDPSLHLGSSNSELSFFNSFIYLFWFESIDFPSKMVWRCKFSLNLPLLGLGPSSKGLGSNLLWLSSHRIALFHWTLDLEPSSKVALNIPFEPPPEKRENNKHVLNCLFGLQTKVKENRV
jgi:hypothetical protein